MIRYFLFNIFEVVIMFYIKICLSRNDSIV